MLALLHCNHLNKTEGDYSAGGAGGLRPPAGARGALAQSPFFFQGRRRRREKDT